MLINRKGELARSLILWFRAHKKCTFDLLRMGITMLDPASLVWLDAATASCQIPLGVITIVWVVLLRRRSDPNAGIFAMAAKVGIGSAGNKSSDHTNRTVYIKHQKLFDFLWILNHFAVTIVASILLGLALGTKEALPATKGNLVSSSKYTGSETRPKIGSGRRACPSLLSGFPLGCPLRVFSSI